MTQFNPKIRVSSDPEALWNSNEINNEITNIDNAISSLDDILLSTIGTQSVNGQKTFFNLYLDSDGIETYESIMETNRSDISPVFGAGTIALEYDGTPEEGGYLKPNVSGFTLKLEPLNPSFMSGNVLIETIGTIGIVGQGTLRITTGNIPICQYDSTFDGTPPSLDINALEHTKFATSLILSGTTMFSGTGVTNNSVPSVIGNTPTVQSTIPYHIVAALRPDTGQYDTFIVEGGYENSIPSPYKWFRTLGITIGNGSVGVLPFTQYAGVTHILNAPYNFYSNNFREYGVIAIDCIVTAYITSTTLKREVRFPNLTSALFTDIPGYYSTNATRYSDFGLYRQYTKVPLTYNTGRNLENTPNLNEYWYAKSMNHGDIIL